MSNPPRATFVDSNVLIDVISHDPDWGNSSRDALVQAADLGSVAINPIVYAEVTVTFSTIERAELALSHLGLARLAIPWSASFLAGKAFLTYRRRGGVRRSPLPDFFIGAHAAVAGMRLLTRDPRRYSEYFPRLEIVGPAA